MTIADSALRAYADAWRTLTPETIDSVLRLCADEFVFKDPFNDTRGIDNLRVILEHMFARTRDPKFTVTAGARTGETGFIAWTFTFETRRSGKRFEIDGVTRLVFDKNDQVIVHVDHWDAANDLYTAIPLLGRILQLLRRTLSPTCT